MSESDGDIEYLDEDADIVQQCVQVVPVPLLIPKVEKVEKKATTPLLIERQPPERKRKKRKVEEDSDTDLNEDNFPPSPPSPQVEENPKTPLLIERQPAERKRKKRKVEEEDSDYDPEEDILPPSPPSPPIVKAKPKKKKQHVVKKVKTYHKESVPSLKDRPTRPPKHFPTKVPVLDRKNCQIKIPDYDDPLCLPVKGLKQEDSDIKRLNNWNSVCLEHFKHCDTLLKPERGETQSSTRTVVFRNVPNKQTGKPETTIWSKTCVENEDGDKKSEIFQCVLPRYKEKKVLTTFSLASRKPKRYLVKDEVVLSKEESKDGEVLVAYKPKEALSAVYKLVAAFNRKSDTNYDAVDKEDDDDMDFKMYMKELAFCKICAPCFQTSWRGVKKNTNKNIGCPICSRSFVTVYNLLAHFKTHSSEDMQKYKMVISAILAEIMDYHYKCRVCREQFISIKLLREHMTTHQGTEVFKCEVGNHMAR